MISIENSDNQLDNSLTNPNAFDWKLNELIKESCKDILSNSKPNKEINCKLGTPQGLIRLLELKLSELGKKIPKRDRLHINFMKGVRNNIKEEFELFLPEFKSSTKEEKLKNVGLVY